MAANARLICHPAHPCPAVTTLQVDASLLADGSLQLHYSLSGVLDALNIPAATQSGFADELWKHTCFEAFVGTPGAAGYREFNFSPSGQWAAYAFSDTRQRDAAWHAAQAPQHATHRRGDTLVLNAGIPRDLLPDTGDAWQIGLTAVVEARDGTLSYWALTHTGERPDFHQRAAFTLRLDTAQT